MHCRIVPWGGLPGVALCWVTKGRRAIGWRRFDHDRLGRPVIDKYLVSPETVWDPGAQLLSQCIVVANSARTLYLSGQTAITADGRFEGVGDVETQIRLSFENIRLILDAAGGTLDNVVKLTVYFVDLDDLDTYTGILGELFPKMRPAQTVVEVSRLALDELLIEIDATAVL